MGSELDRAIAKQKIAEIFAKYGCIPINAPDGPVVEHFEPQAVAAAIEQEITRARVYGWTRITLHMDVADALMLAQCLRR